MGFEQPGVAFVQDWLVVRSGSERILEASLECLPQAPVYTLVHRPEAFEGSELAHPKVTTSFIQKFPRAHAYYPYYLPFMPLAIEQFDLRAFPMLISISYAVAHGILTHPDQRHIAYICSPARYAWHLYQDYLEIGRLQHGVRSWLARILLHYLRVWDYAASRRANHTLAVSKWVARCIWHIYQKPAEVLYPPVEVARFQPSNQREDFYLTVSRQVPYKKIHLLVEAFHHLDKPLIVVGEGSERAAIERIARPNVQFLGRVKDEEVADLMSRARGFVYMAEEDFGIALVEAQAAGCPVIAYAGGAASETVLHGKTGLLFRKQDAASLVQMITTFEENRSAFQISDLRTNAERFSRERYQREFMTILSQQAEIQQKTID